jgi:hypothetical protein
LIIPFTLVFSGCQFDQGGLASGGTLDLSAKRDTLVLLDAPASFDADSRPDSRIDSPLDQGPRADTILRPPVSAPARLWYAVGGLPILQEMRWDPFLANWQIEQGPYENLQVVQWLRAIQTRQGNPLIAVESALSGSDLRMRSFEKRGPSWGMLFDGPAQLMRDTRDFAVAGLSQSDEVVFVYGRDTTLRMVRRVNGAVQPATDIPLKTTSGDDIIEDVPLWVELYSNPLRDELALVVADSGGHLGVWLWSPTRGWDLTRSRQLSKKLRVNEHSNTLSSRCFDAAFEASGDLLVAWGHQDKNGFYSHVLTNAGWTDLGQSLAPNKGRVDFVDLSAKPGADAVAGVFVAQNNQERLGLALWDGQRWQAAGTYDDVIRDTNHRNHGDFPAAVAWTALGPIAVYSDNYSNRLHWFGWSSGRFLRGADFRLLGKGLTESVQLVSDGRGGLLLAISDTKQQLFGAYFANGQWQAGGLLAVNLVAADRLSFELLGGR